MMLLIHRRYRRGTVGQVADRRRRLAVLGAAIVGVATQVGCANAASGTRIAPPAVGTRYLGAYPGYGTGEENRVTFRALQRYRADSGRKPAWVYFSNEWGQEGVRYPGRAVAVIRRSGSVPFVRLMPRSTLDDGARERRFTLERIIAGDFDAELRAWGAAAGAANKPLLVEFLTEVNGDWFSWNGRFHGAGATTGYGDPSRPDGPERARDAYRHVVTMVRAGGGTNITWVFHIDADGSPAVAWNAARNYYPGDAYVDWIGFSAYGAQTRFDPWIAPGPIIRAGYRRAASLSPTKPIALLEFGVTERRGVSKAKWIDGAFDVVQSRSLRRLVGVSWWNERFQNADRTWTDLRITSSQSAKATFRRRVASPRFVDTIVVRR
jgi:hypothetical protein